MPEQNLTPEILAAALQGLEARQARLDAHIAAVTRLPGARPQQPSVPAEASKLRRKMSAAGRKRIVEATRKRRAEFHRKQAEAAKAKEQAVKEKAAMVAAKQLVAAEAAPE